MVRILATAVVALGVSAPMGLAQSGQREPETIGEFFNALACSLNPANCQPARPTRGAAGGNAGFEDAAGWGWGDAVQLDPTQVMWVQGGLQALGHYDGPIDGFMEEPTRAAIRSYQASIGADPTGRLRGGEINALVAQAPQFARLEAGDPALFGADLANDLEYDGIRQLQEGLTAAGFDAGYPDGVFGGMTRAAIEGYKLANGLPGGPVATGRLLAHVTGRAPTRTASAAVPGAANAAAVVPRRTTFTLSGIRLGMDEGEGARVLDAALGAGRLIEMAPGSMFGGNEAFTSATLSVQDRWPGARAEQIVTFRNSSRPELGFLAAFRLIRLPAGMDQAAFEAQVLPGIVAQLPAEARVPGQLAWIGDPAARAAAATDAAALAACGDLRIAAFDHDQQARRSFWSMGHGPILDPASLESVSADCGEVVRVSFEAPIVRVQLWNSSYLAE